MRFWDSSAVVSLCVTEPASPVARDLYRVDPAVAVWWSTPVECASAFARLRRSHLLDRGAEATARDRLDELASLWVEIQPGADLRDEAMRVLESHTLTAADALQLSAGLEWMGGEPNGASFVTFDRQLADAARREGFDVPETTEFET